MASKQVGILIFSLISSCIFAQQKTITIATLEYPPFIYSDGTKAKGPIVDKVEHIFNRLNINADIQILPITRGLLMVKNGDVDAYFSLKKTPEREHDLLFTKEPLIQQPFVFFVSKNSNMSWTGNLEEIKNYKIGIVSKTSYGKTFDECVKKGLFTNLDESQSFELNIKKLIAGRIDLAINSYDVGMYLLKKLNAENQIIALKPSIETVNSYLAFTKTKDYASLAAQFDKILEEENK